MQDGVPWQLSKVATEVMKKNKISLLEWPGNSPDLNPIENLWTIIKDKVAYEQLWSAENPMQAINEVWVPEITQEYSKSLVSSMPHRIQAVIDSKEHTEYWKVATLTLLDVIKFQIVLYHAFREINLYNLVWMQKKKSQFCQFYLKNYIWS